MERAILWRQNSQGDLTCLELELQLNAPGIHLEKIITLDFKQNKTKPPPHFLSPLLFLYSLIGRGVEGSGRRRPGFRIGPDVDSLGDPGQGSPVSGPVFPSKQCTGVSSEQLDMELKPEELKSTIP